MSVLGSGSVTEGTICDRTGTSEGINYCTKNNIRLEGFRTLPHIIPELFTVSGLIPNSGALYIEKSFRELLDNYKKIIDKYIEKKLPIKEIHIVGGHSLDDEFNIMKSKLYHFPLKVYPEGAELIGNAALGAFVLGRYESLISASEAMVRERICYNI